MLPPPLFSVDILDSQISDNNVSVGKCRHEKYDTIQITYIENFIWQGEVWSNIYFKIKVNKPFFIVQ